jgi:N-carbamoylputrescine amidase
MKKVNIGLVQMSCSDNVADNMQKAISGIREAAAKGAQIVCLQELFTSLYFCDVEDHENFKLAEAIPTIDRYSICCCQRIGRCNHRFII